VDVYIFLCYNLGQKRFMRKHELKRGNFMKKAVTLIVLLLAMMLLSGCVRSYSLFYDYDDVRQSFVRAEIIYMEERVSFFVTHWYVDIEPTDYQVKRELSAEEADRLIRTLSNVEFTYTILWAPVSVSNEFSMQGYAIKLHYEPNAELSYGENAFIILAQNGDYRYAMPRFGQARAGRTATDEDWNALIAEFYPD